MTAFKGSKSRQAGISQSHAVIVKSVSDQAARYDLRSVQGIGEHASGLSQRLLWHFVITSAAPVIWWTARMKRQRPCCAGFTLLEILVAVAVMGLLLIGLLQGSRFVQFGWNQQARMLTGKENLDAVDRTLRHLFEQAKPGSEWESLWFVGNAHTVSFIGVVKRPAAVDKTQRADVTLGVDSAHRLLMVWAPHSHVIWTSLQPPASTTEILSGVQRLDLSYWRAEGGGWISSWQDSAPPRLVRIRIVFLAEGAAPWPDIVVAPMLDPT